MKERRTEEGTGDLVSVEYGLQYKGMTYMPLMIIVALQFLACQRTQANSKSNEKAPENAIMRLHGGQQIRHTGVTIMPQLLLQK